MRKLLVFLFIMVWFSGYGQRIINHKMYQVGRGNPHLFEKTGDRYSCYFSYGRYEFIGVRGGSYRPANIFQFNLQLDSLNFTLIDSGNTAGFTAFAGIDENRILATGLKWFNPFAFDTSIGGTLAIYDQSFKKLIKEVRYRNVEQEEIFGANMIFIENNNRYWMYGGRWHPLEREFKPYVTIYDSTLAELHTQTYWDTGAFAPEQIIKRGPNEYWMLGMQSYDSWVPGPDRLMAHGCKYVVDSNGTFLRKDIFDIRDDSLGFRFGMRGTRETRFDCLPTPDGRFILTGYLGGNPNYSTSPQRDSIYYIALMDSTLKRPIWVKRYADAGIVKVLEDNTFIRVSETFSSPSNPLQNLIEKLEVTSGQVISYYTITPVFQGPGNSRVSIAPHTFDFVGDSTMLFTGLMGIETSPNVWRRYSGYQGMFLLKGIPNQFEPVSLSRAVTGATEPQLLAYPSPFSEQLSIKAASGFLSGQEGLLTLYNTQGQQVHGAPYKLESILSLPHLPAGVYHYHFSAGTASASGRVVKW